MRILLVNKFYYLVGGVERYVFEWEKILKSKGHEVIIFSMKSLQNNEHRLYCKFINNQAKTNIIYYTYISRHKNRHKARHG